MHTIPVISRFLDVSKTDVSSIFTCRAWRVWLSIAMLTACFGVYTVQAAEVTTDASDYEPGSTAFISGTGFSPGETVILQVLHHDGTPATGEDHEPWAVMTGPDGSFESTWHVCEDDCVNSTLRLSAVGQTSGATAEAIFTDAVLFGFGLQAVIATDGGCVRNVTTTTNVMVFVRPGFAYRFTFFGQTNGIVPPCLGTNPPTLPFTLGPTFGSSTLTAIRQATSTFYTNIFRIPSTACSNTPIIFTCTNGSTGQVLFGLSPVGRPVLLIASSDCTNTVVCNSDVSPTISCPANIVVGNDASQCSAVVNYQLPTATGTPTPTVTCNPPPGSAFPKGTTMVTCVAANSAGTNSCTFSVTVMDTEPPVLTCPADVVVAANANQCSAVVVFSVGASDNCPGVVSISSPPSGSAFPVGTTTVRTVAVDASGKSNECSFNITVVDQQPPTINQCAPATTISAGSNCQAVVPDLTGQVAASDNCTAPQDLIVSQVPAAGTLIGLGTVPVAITVADSAGNTSTCMSSVDVVNAAPVIGAISGPLAPIALGTAASIVVNFTDSDANQPHNVTFDWDDGNSETVSLAASVGTATATHTYAASGVYSVGVVVNDGCVSVTKTFLFVVVYDPNGGFVTGGGWFNSPAGAYTAAPSLTGTANFGFVSKYHNGASVPTGNTEFQFQAGSLRFDSSDYQWLVVAGAKAQYKGIGRINGTAGYTFLLTATDGAASGPSNPDRFRIKIWNSGGVVYDNALSASDDIDAADPQEIAAGNIVVHK